MSDCVNNISDRVNSILASRLDVQYITGADTAVLPPFPDFNMVMPYTSISCFLPYEDRPFPGIDCQIGDTLCHAGPGDCLICPADSERRFFHRDPGHRSVWAHLNILLDANFQLVHFFDIPNVIRGEAAARIRKLIDILNRGRKNIQEADRQTEIAARRPAALPDLLEERAVLLLLLKELLATATPRDTLPLVVQGFLELEPAIRFIRKHKFEKIRLDDLAARCHCCRSAFEKKFRAAFGTSPGRYLLNLRLAEAEQLLLNSDESCATIAEKTGFANQFIFSRQFRGRCGLSPSEYRSTRTSVH